MKHYTTDESGDLIEITDEADLFIAMLSDAAIELTDDQFLTVCLINSMVKQIEPSAQTDGIATADFAKNFGIDLSWDFYTEDRFVYCLSPTGQRIWLEVI